MNRLLFLLILLFLPSAIAGTKPVTTAGQVSLILDDVPLRQALQALAETGQRNLIIAADVQGSVSLHLQNVAWQQAFAAVIDSGQLHWRQQGGVIYIYSQQWLEQQREQQQQRQLSQPLENKIIALRYASADELAETLSALGDKLLTTRGSVNGDKRTNRLLLRDTHQAVKNIQQWITQMDVPTGQVELAAFIVTINQNSLKELGIKWGTTPSPHPSAAYGLHHLAANFAGSETSGRAGFTIGRLNGGMLELELSALEQKNQLEIIANPRLIASHQQPASIKQGSEIPYQVSTGQNGATAIQFKEAVLGMEVTPTIMAEKHIQLKLRISQNMPGRVLKQANGEALAIDKQEIETQLFVKDGETIALGGIFQHQRQTGNDKLPLLGDIPLFGKLFRYDGNAQQRRELVVFITPRILAGE